MRNLRLSDKVTQKQLTEIYSNPYIINAIKQDGRDFSPIRHNLVTYYSAFVDDKFVGLFLQIKFSPWEIELHSLLTQKAIKYSRQLGKLIIAKSFNDNQQIQRITVLIIDGLNTVKNYCEKIGFKLEGIKRNACLKDNKFKDVYIYGITRKDWSKL